MNSYSQDSEEECKKTTNKKALKLFDEAKKEHDWTKFQEIIADAVAEEEKFPQAYQLLANRALKRNSLQIELKLKKTDVEENLQIFIDASKKIIEICPDFSSEPYFNLGLYFFEKKKYDDAIKYFKDVRKFEKAKAEDIKYADSIVRVSKLLKSPVPFEPVSLPGVCSEKDEYLPTISPDNEIAYYTRRYDKIRRGDLYPTPVEEFSFSLLDTNTSKFDKGDAMQAPFNTSYNEGGASTSIDNNTLYFTVCKPAGSYVNCDIFYSERVNGTWGPIKNLGPQVNEPKSWDSQPCIASDNKTLYFASDRNETAKMDIYVTEKNDSGKWSKPVSLGAKINTTGNEKTPFIHPDNRTLYFSSDGHPGLGGFDIFFSKKDSVGNWTTPKNIGYPINSENDDLGFFVSTDGKTGYFASNKLKGKGGYDVYYFPLYEGARPEKVLFVKGELDKNENDTTTSLATVELKNVTTKEVTKLKVDSASRKFVGVVAMKDDYILTMKKEGYGFDSKYFSKKDTTLSTKPQKTELKMSKLETGAVFTLNNIYYKSNSADLAEESVNVINEFVEFLKENPKIKVEICGHTDNVGDEKKNLALSADRAFTVYDLALQQGVEKSRLSFKGYGKSKPIASNDTEAGRAKNRRTEFVIVAK